jgi:sec-independent protein translocase protein TatA
MPNIGLPEIIIVLVIALIIFGPKRLPELGQSLGRGIKEFKGSVSGENKDDDSVEAKNAQLEAADGGKTDATAETVDGEVVTENKA